MNTQTTPVEADTDAKRSVTESEAVDVAPTSGVYTVLEVGGEGGGYTIVADGSSAQTRFRRLASTGEDLYFDGLDDFNPVEEEQTLPWCDSLSEALQTINPSWPLLSGIFVHPAHRKEVCNLWETQLKKSGQEESVYPHKRQRWMELFGNRMSNALQTPAVTGPPLRLGNRVAPDGSLFDTKARGSLMGNRGVLKEKNGHYNTPAGFRVWIHCVTTAPDLPNYQPRDVKYTKLFFTDEATALSAGHRPCGYCLRPRLNDFKQAWFDANRTLYAGKSATLDTLDRILHAERMATTHRPCVSVHMGELPDGTFFRMGGSTHLSLQGVAVEWSQGGYIGAVIAPETASIQLLTPPSIINLYSTGW